MKERSLDIITESHRLANERRAQNKPAWDSKIDIRSIIKRDQGREDAQYVVGIANEIGELLKHKVPSEYLDVESENCDWEFMEAVDALCQMTVEEFEGDEAGAVEEFNGRLSEVYDWADLNRVWLGS